MSMKDRMKNKIYHENDGYLLIKIEDKLNVKIPIAIDNVRNI
jgi:hypothetical protein